MGFSKHLRDSKGAKRILIVSDSTQLKSKVIKAFGVDFGRDGVKLVFLRKLMLWE
jgi:hypothetical protein